MVENYQGCTKDKYGLVVAAERRAAGDPELAQIVDGLQSYFTNDRRQYAQFVRCRCLDAVEANLPVRIFGIGTIKGE